MGKVDKNEPFDANRLVNDFLEGRVEWAEAKPDFKYHEPHVDLNVRPAGGVTVTYRVFDADAARDLPSGGWRLP